MHQSRLSPEFPARKKRRAGLTAATAAALAAGLLGCSTPSTQGAAPSATVTVTASPSVTATSMPTATTTDSASASESASPSESASASEGSSPSDAPSPSSSSSASNPSSVKVPLATGAILNTKASSELAKIMGPNARPQPASDAKVVMSQFAAVDKISTVTPAACRPLSNQTLSWAMKGAEVGIAGDMEAGYIVSITKLPADAPALPELVSSLAPCKSMTVEADGQTMNFTAMGAVYDEGGFYSGVLQTEGETIEGTSGAQAFAEKDGYRITVSGGNPDVPVADMRALAVKLLKSAME